MSNEIEEQVEGSEETLDDDTGEENQTPDKASKNKSNFKNLSEKAKRLERELEEERKARKEEQEELNAWRSENSEIIEKTLSKKETKWTDRSELALFIAINPEAREHLDAIKEFAEDFGIKLDSEEALTKAWKRVKPTVTESSSNKDFSIGNKSKPTKVDLSKVTFDEIYSQDSGGNDVYTKEQRAEWRAKHNK